MNILGYYGPTRIADNDSHFKPSGYCRVITDNDYPLTALPTAEYGTGWIIPVSFSTLSPGLHSLGTITDPSHDNALLQAVRAPGLLLIHVRSDFSIARKCPVASMLFMQSSLRTQRSQSSLGDFQSKQAPSYVSWLTGS